MFPPRGKHAGVCEGKDGGGDDFKQPLEPGFVGRFPLSPLFSFVKYEGFLIDTDICSRRHCVVFILCVGFLLRCLSQGTAAVADHRKSIVDEPPRGLGTSVYQRTSLGASRPCCSSA